MLDRSLIRERMAFYQKESIMTTHLESEGETSLRRAGGLIIMITANDNSDHFLGTLISDSGVLL